MLKFPAISVWGLMCELSFSNVSFMYVDALVFGIDAKYSDFILIDYSCGEYEVFFSTSSDWF